MFCFRQKKIKAEKKRATVAKRNVQISIASSFLFLITITNQQINRYYFHTFICFFRRTDNSMAGGGKFKRAKDKGAKSKSKKKKNKSPLDKGRVCAVRLS